MVRTLDDLDVSGVTVGVRVDINSPIDDGGGLADDARVRAHLGTLSELADGGARVVVLAHQGRPGGGDFTTLESHAEHLDALLEAPVSYVDGTFCAAAREAVRSLSDGAVLVLENTRFYSEEYMSFEPSVASRTHLVARLSEVLDVFVNDAFATAHRSQPSIVGFPQQLPAYAGRVMEAELDALGDVSSTPRPRVYSLGGAKAADSVEIAETVLGDDLADAVVTSGVVGNAFLRAAGVDLGPETNAVVDERVEGELPRATRLLDEYPDRIHLPTDLVIERHGERCVVDVDDLPVDEPAMDIGPATVEAYTEVFEDAGTAILNGPAGVFEEPVFAHGTRNLFVAAQRAGYTIVGGGDTAAALRRLELTGFDHISTGGGAALAMLTGNRLPGVSVLEQ